MSRDNAWKVVVDLDLGSLGQNLDQKIQSLRYQFANMDGDLQSFDGQSSEDYFVQVRRLFELSKMPNNEEVIKESDQIARKFPALQKLSLEVQDRAQKQLAEQIGQNIKAILDDGYLNIKREMVKARYKAEKEDYDRARGFGILDTFVYTLLGRKVPEAPKLQEATLSDAEKIVLQKISDAIKADLQNKNMLAKLVINNPELTGDMLVDKIITANINNFSALFRTIDKSTSTQGLEGLDLEGLVSESLRALPKTKLLINTVEKSGNLALPGTLRESQQATKLAAADAPSRSDAAKKKDQKKEKRLARVKARRNPEEVEVVEPSTPEEAISPKGKTAAQLARKSRKRAQQNAKKEVFSEPEVATEEPKRTFTPPMPTRKSRVESYATAVAPEVTGPKQLEEGVKVYNKKATDLKVKLHHAVYSPDSQITKDQRKLALRTMAELVEYKPSEKPIKEQLEEIDGKMRKLRYQEAVVSKIIPKKKEKESDIVSDDVAVQPRPVAEVMDRVSYASAVVGGVQEELKFSEIHASAIKGDEAAIQYLADAGRIDERDQVGATDLHYAASSGTNKAVKLLIDAGADVNAVDADGCTPMDYALKEKRIEAVKLLFKAGAGADVVKDGKVTTLIDYAYEQGRKEEVDLLKKAGAKLSFRNALLGRKGSSVGAPDFTPSNGSKGSGSPQR